MRVERRLPRPRRLRNFHSEPKKASNRRKPEHHRHGDMCSHGGSHFMQTVAKGCLLGVNTAGPGSYGSTLGRMGATAAFGTVVRKP
jgi:hypothetical protein